MDIKITFMLILQLKIMFQHGLSNQMFIRPIELENTEDYVHLLVSTGVTCKCALSIIAIF